jgi:hypothetical protein
MDFAESKLADYASSQKTFGELQAKRDALEAEVGRCRGHTCLTVNEAPAVRAGREAGQAGARTVSATAG